MPKEFNQTVSDDYAKKHEIIFKMLISRGKSVHDEILKDISLHQNNLLNKTEFAIKMFKLLRPLSLETRITVDDFKEFFEKEKNHIVGFILQFKASMDPDFIKDVGDSIIADVSEKRRSILIKTMMPKFSPDYERQGDGKYMKSYKEAYRKELSKADSEFKSYLDNQFHQVKNEMEFKLNSLLDKYNITLKRDEIDSILERWLNKNNLERIKVIYYNDVINPKISNRKNRKKIIEESRKNIDRDTPKKEKTSKVRFKLDI